ncbi:hypothetical protein [Streptomyces sp. NPDC048172]|uniref:hypothetical protein n=1 Tax=Streptomyces sp. NPDC048172 TaxID=3365505 RepID=UPI003723AF5E
MGTDIRGFVECLAGESWHAAVDLSLLGVTRDYAAFACLFGVRGSEGLWRPVAAGRGLPADASEAAWTAYASWGAAAFGATWLGWDEVLAVDWDEPALPRATTVARYRRRADGTADGVLELAHRDDWSRGFARASGVDTLSVSPDRVGELWDEGTEWDTGTTVFRVERERRRDAVPADGPWRPVWDVMRALAGVHGDAGVRLTVWFEE